MSEELVLVVCAANVCRSPLAELLLSRELTALSGVRVESAGTRVRGGQGAVCEQVALREADEVWRSAAREHSPRPVTAELLHAASLILVADSEVRSEVVRTLPEVRDMVFTLRDAAFLSGGFSPDEPTRRTRLASRFAVHLDQARALRDRPTRRRGLLMRRAGVDWSSIEDGHNRSSRKHLAALDEVTVAAMTIAAALGGGRSTSLGAG